MLFQAVYAENLASGEKTKLRENWAIFDKIRSAVNRGLCCGCGVVPSLHVCIAIFRPLGRNSEQKSK